MCQIQSTIFQSIHDFSQKEIMSVFLDKIVDYYEKNGDQRLKFEIFDQEFLQKLKNCRDFFQSKCNKVRCRKNQFFIKKEEKSTKQIKISIMLGSSNPTKFPPLKL